MIKQHRLEILLDYIENFEDKGIKISFLFPVQSAGSFLLDSLINGHENVLSIPTFFSSYEYMDEFENNRNIPLEQIVRNFTRSGFFTHTQQVVGNKIPEENKTEEFFLQFESILLSILKNLTKLNSKNFFLAVNFAYAYIKNIDITKIKVIFTHHHKSPSLYSFEKCVIEETNIFKRINADFPDTKILITTRNFIEHHIRNMQICKSDPSGYLEVTDFLSVYSMVGYYYTALILQHIYKKNLKFIKFENIHLKTKETMEEIADFLGIAYDNSMLESTFEGKLWFWSGYNSLHQQAKNGINPNYDQNKYKKDFNDPIAQALYSKLFNSLNRIFGYEEYKDYKEIKNIYQLTQIEKSTLCLIFFNISMVSPDKTQENFSLFNSIKDILIYSLKKIFLEQDFYYLGNILMLINNIKCYLFEYKKKRKEILNQLFMLSDKFDELNSIEEFANFWLDENRFEKNFLEKTEFKAYLKNLEKKYKNKSIVIYGASKLFSVLCKEYDLSNLNIVGVIDRKYEQNNKSTDHPYPTIPLSKIDEYNFDVILISMLKFNKHFINYMKKELLKNKNKIKLEFLYKKNLIDLLKIFIN